MIRRSNPWKARVWSSAANVHQPHDDTQPTDRFPRRRVHDQLQKVVTIMKLCDNMEEFRQKFARVFKRTPLQLGFADVNWNVEVPR
jgi:hypothetical protein